MLSGKKILIGITGGISAYKSAFLVRLFKKANAEVKVIMTEAAKQFVQPLTFATLSQNPVYTDFFNPENGEWNSHVRLGLWADLFVIAPATANTVAKIANGIADNLLTTTCLSARCKIMVAPAMDLDMYSNPATQKNFSTLKECGILFAEAGDGFLASGLSGKGRMAEPEEIFAEAKNFLLQNQDFEGKKVLITAGPTREKIDPVRFISNYSTGKMGYAIAEEFAERGAEVILVSGPVEVTAKNHKINVLKVNSAKEMYEECMKNFPQSDIAIMSAAVADFTPENTAETKIKKTGEEMTIKLKPTKDIAKELGKIKRENQIFIGFALETDHEMQNAEKKLDSKNFDFIVLNSLKDKGAAFGYDTNKITIISKNGIENFDLKPKNLVAKDIADKVKQLLKK
ncbi:MAG: bifunctional phosphopantothenoylcysteine decarboxylase/phosphopantothenate--cysteine ligase CoaBC [Bacteroidales bacterium]|nr:bifunctional phosphopantothenoylcysteine decarboxylase/phosphopantothenate--cysteine ligase CoaBC [Bacteroidales bacterium]